MQVIWHGHSAITLLADGLNILIDPLFLDGKIPLSAQNPDLILLTHDHADHLGSTQAILQNSQAVLGCITDLASWLAPTWNLPPKGVLNGGGWNIGGSIHWRGLEIRMTAAVHSSPHGQPVGYVLSFPERKQIYHAGDTALFGDMALLADEFELDLALLPIGGVYTMNPKHAAKACALLRAKAVMPMHYASFEGLESSADSFLSELAVWSPQTRPIVAVQGVPFEI